MFAVTQQELDRGLGLQGAPKQHMSDLSMQLQRRPSWMVNHRVREALFPTDFCHVVPLSHFHYPYHII